jgi:hypothetical protein
LPVERGHAMDQKKYERIVLMKIPSDLEIYVA